MAETPEPSLASARIVAAAKYPVALPPFLERHRFLLVFASLSSVMGTSVGVAKVTTSLYAVHLGASPTELGMIAGAQSIGVLIMSLPLGFLVEQFGPGRLFVLGTLAAASLYAAVPLVASAAYLLVFTILISFFMPFRFVSLNSVFMSQLESIGESKAGWYRGTHMLGMFLLGPALATVVLRAFDFAGTYRSIAVAFLITIALSPIVFGPYARSRRSERRVSWAGIVEQLGLLAKDTELRQVCSIEGLGQAAAGYFSFFIVVVAMDRLGLDRAQASTLVALNGVSFVAALFTLGGMVRHLGPRRIYRMSFLVGGVSLLVLGFAQSQAALWVGALGLGLGLGTLQIVNLTRFARSGARLGRGKMAGLNALVSPAGAVLGNLVGGVVGGAFGPQAMFLVFAPLFVLASVLAGAGVAAPLPGVAPRE
jgi:MFS family permease